MGFSTSDHKKTIFMTSSNNSVTLDEDDVTVYFDNYSYNGQLYLYINDSSAAKSFTMIVRSHNSSYNSYYPRVRFYSGGTYRWLYLKGDIQGHVYKCYRNGSTWKVIDVNNGTLLDLYSDQFARTTNNGSLYTIDGKLDTAKITSFNTKVDARVNAAMVNGNELYRDYRVWTSSMKNGSRYTVFDDGYISLDAYWNSGNGYFYPRIFNRSGETLYIAYHEININADNYYYNTLSNGSNWTPWSGMSSGTYETFILSAYNSNGTSFSQYIIQYWMYSSAATRIISVAPVISL